MFSAAQRLEVAALCGLLLFVAPVSAPGDDEVPASARSTVTAGHRRCPRLFGGAKTRVKNRARRQRLLHLAVAEPSGITIAHSSRRWKEPSPLEIKGVKLLKADGEVALVQVSRALGQRVGCDPGSYRVAADHALGLRTRVLAVFDDVVLVENRGQLAYLPTPDAAPPRWLMAWKLPGATVYPPQGGRTARPPPRHRPKPRPKRAPPPRPKRKR